MSDDFKLDFQAVIIFNFILEKDIEEVHRKLRRIYEDTLHTSPRVLSPSGTGSPGSTFLFHDPILNGQVDFPIANLSRFETTFTYMMDVDSSVISLITVGILSDESRNLVEQDDEGEKLVKEYMRDLRDFSEIIPTITNLDFSPDIAYIELENPELSAAEAKNEKHLQQIWREYHSEINKYHISLGQLKGAASILDLDDESYLITPQVYSNPLIDLTVLNLTPRSVDRDPNELPYWFDF